MVNMTRETTFPDEPEAHALYDRMVEAASKAASLFYESLMVLSRGQEQAACTYRLWMRKRPFGVRVEVRRDGALAGVLVNDGKQTWIYWPGGRSFYNGEDPAEYERTRFISYARETRHPVLLKYFIPRAGTVMAPILEPSVFWSGWDSAQHVRDGMRRLGTEEVDREACDVIEIRHMQGMRNKTLWLAQRDGLPRRLAEVIHAASDLVEHEEAISIRLDEELPPEMFVWEPPAEWEEWRPPDPEARRLKPGAEAPDFEATTVDGRRVRLSDYRGQVVWLVFWRLTCPRCREEIPYLEPWHRRCADAGLAILGFNYSDKEETLRAFLREHGITFPNILDATGHGQEIMDRYPYGSVPANTIIDREGKVAASFGWSGGPKEPGDRPEKEILVRLGILPPGEPVPGAP